MNLEASTGNSRAAALLMICGGILLAVLLNWDEIRAATYKDVATEAPKLVVALTVIAILMERALAVVDAAWLGEEIEQARAAQRVSITGLTLLSRPGPAVPASAEAFATAQEQMQTSSIALAIVDAKQQRLRVVLGFLVGLVISAAGVRSLSALVTNPGGTLYINLFSLADIVITAGLLAGGSNGMAKLTELIGAAIGRTMDRIAGLR